MTAAPALRHHGAAGEHYPRPRQAPVTVTKGGVVTTLAYDANGNMTAGLDGKVMAYDGENRPLSVTFGGVKTCYSYGADGSRLKKVEGLTPAANCPTAPTGAGVTAYFANVEVRNYGQAAATETILTYPAPAVRLTTTSSGTTASILHRDQLGSVRGLTGATGTKAELSTYRPFGEQDEVLTGSPVNETKGYVGERYDADAGLQFLNARYYDPKLGMFLQPDWFDVTKAGVGTNRFAYSGNDPVNAGDPGGNYSLADFGEDVWNAISGFGGGAVANADFDKTVKGAGVGAAAGGVVGGIAGAATGCGVSLCAGSAVAAPAGAEAGFLVGGAAGGVIGIGLDSGEVISGGIAGAYEAVVQGQRKRAQEKLAALGVAGTVVHGNSALSTRPTELYHLINRTTGAIDKIGVTSAENPPSGRYSQAFLERENVRYETKRTFNSRAAAYLAESIDLTFHFIENGSLPRLNRGFR